MNFKNILTFPMLVLFSGLGLSFCAAWYSIIGISTLFIGAAISVSIMASFLELAKIVMTTFLYRYWNKCNKLFKIYAITAIIILMIITAAGISGVLLSSYQASSIENGISEQKIAVFENQKSYSQLKIEDARKRVNQIIELRDQQEARLNESITNKLIVRNPIQMAQIQDQTQGLIEQSHTDLLLQNDIIQKGTTELQDFDEKISNLKLKNSGKKDILIFKFVADAIHLDLNTTVKWFIVLLITVFDPLALCLLLAYNTAIFANKKDEIAPITPSNVTSQVIESAPATEQPIPNPENITHSNVPNVKSKEPNRMRGLFHF